MSKIPFHIVTGFLGSGKTTFLKKYLAICSSEKRVGIIQNEFAPVNVDSVDLKNERDDFRILEVNNGSVFCVCLLGSFIGSLAKFIAEVQPDELIMEASGMSDPTSIGQILQAKELKDKLYLDQIWCVVDAKNFNRMSGLQSRIFQQVRIADTIIVNKTDLVPEYSTQLKDELRKTNPFAAIETTSYCDVSFQKNKIPFKVFPELNSDVSRPDLHSAVVKTNLQITEEKLQQFIAEMKKFVIRCKGHIHIKNGKRLFIQGIYDSYELKETAYFEAPTEFVIIGNFNLPDYFLHLFENFCKND